jgi:hypothetical protein
VAERQPLKSEFRSRIRCKRRLKSFGLADAGCNGSSLAQIVDDKCRAHRRQLVEHRRNLGADFDALASVPVAVGCDEQHRLDLTEAVEHTLLAKVGGTGRPDRPERCSGEHARNRLRHIRHHRRDSVARLDAMNAEQLLHARDQRAQLVPRQHTFNLVLAAEDDRLRAAALLQEVFREVQLRVGEELCARHLVAVDQHPLATLADDAAIIPDERPEGLAVVDRPVVEGPVAVQLRAA